MSIVAEVGLSRSLLRGTLVAAAIFVAAAALWLPQHSWETLAFVASGLIEVTPLVIPGILLTAWVIASGANSRIASVFTGHAIRTVVIASMIGAVTPVCGVTVLPLMAGLLASGVPLAPVMAFWLSSPVTDPAMLATTVATLGPGFAAGKTVAAFGLGLLGGFVTVALSARRWTQAPLRDNNLVNSLNSGCSNESVEFVRYPWTHPERRKRFISQLIATTRLILICLIPAFAAEHMLNELVQPQALTQYVGSDTWWAIPLAVFVGAPAYIDGYAALPLTRGLMDHGMSPGAAMAFLVSGGVVSIWGAMAIFPVLKIRPFLLYLAMAVIGSLIAGWVYGYVA